MIKLNTKTIDDKYSLALTTLIRSKNTQIDDLKNALLQVGARIGSEIVADNMLIKSEVTTPMDQQFQGFSFSNCLNLLYSTKDDFNYFAKGIATAIPNVEQGYFDFQGKRGLDALTLPIRAVSHPPINKDTPIESVIIAKAVLATGCTAISLTKNIISKYYPKKIIIATAFYSIRGVQELTKEIPSIDWIYKIGKAELLNEKGMLVPGVGNLDERLSG